jgi:YfiH family protein
MPSEAAHRAVTARAAPRETPATGRALAESDLIRPAWAAPAAVGALMSTRRGGVSTGAWSSLNLGRSVGDDPQAVAENRRRLAASLLTRDASAAEIPHPQRMSQTAGTPVRPVWLHQVHGTTVLELDSDTPEHAPQPADAAWTRTAGIACLVGAADCLPVLFAARDGRAVAAAHAGWRGLAAGVLEATVAALRQGAGVAADELLAWLGPCIGQGQFEVGADVLQAFRIEAQAADTEHFAYAPRPAGAPRWRADLQGLARERLQRLGVREITAERACTYEDASRFFSFRRDSRLGSASGRMAAAVWIEPGR